MTSERDVTPEAEGVPEQEAAPAPEATAQEEELAASDLARQLAERTLDLQRLQAEYVNYKRRVDRDREVQRVNATASVLVSFLPVLDDIGRARDHGELEGGFKAVADSLVQATSAHGLEPFGKHGDVFDPMLHEALMHRLDADAPEGEPTVDAIMQVGYRIGDKILRPARVSVVEHDPAGEAEATSEVDGASEPTAE
ncbi:nucleotide exchange factor GrpE [Mumia sp. ZJ430]|uniref:nucleotide exchange factor GrpE n=1 Tax=Mumia sp. ZJ430 TaxID=2708083 RepID=UPI001423C7EE|nr:nucleotide exchange factor GrpE [Mumia sp. ZJ430]